MDEFNLIEKYPQPIDLLSKIFPKGHFTTERIQRLDEIYRECEAKWEENLQRFQGGKVKYLLIAEAAPWSEPLKPVSYFYNTCGGQWVNRIWRTFFDYKKPTDPEQALAQFATQGFLLIDSLPFAERYSAGQRNTKLYSQLVNSSIPYFEGKIRNPLIDWSDNVKVALAFKIHGRTLTQALPKGLDLPTGQKCSLSYDLICADGSGYTSPKLLRSAFGIGVR
jgi:hypothetical protein